MRIGSRRPCPGSRRSRSFLVKRAFWFPHRLNRFKPKPWNGWAFSTAATRRRAPTCGSTSTTSPFLPAWSSAIVPTAFGFYGRNFLAARPHPRDCRGDSISGGRVIIDPWWRKAFFWSFLPTSAGQSWTPRQCRWKHKSHFSKTPRRSSPSTALGRRTSPGALQVARFWSCALCII